MKFRNIKTGLALTGMIVLSIIGCKKEKMESVTPASDNQAVEMTVLADQTDADYLDATSKGGDENIAFYAENEGLSEEYLMDETSYDAPLRANGERIIHCLKEVKLSDEQVTKLRVSFKNFVECKASDIAKHRQAYKALAERTEGARKELVTKLKAGKITKEQFEKSIKELRVKFEKSLKEIKESYAKTLRACFDRFLGSIKERLTERQWVAFTKCFKK